MAETTHKLTVGPRVGMAIIFVVILISFVAGARYGNQECLNAGLQNEVIVMKDDNIVGHEIQLLEIEQEKEADAYAVKLKKANKGSCGKLSIRQLIRVCNAQESK